MLFIHDDSKEAKPLQQIKLEFLLKLLYPV